MLLKLITVAMAFWFKTSNCLSNITANQYALMPELFLYDDYKSCMYSGNNNNPIYCRVTVELFPENLRNTSLVWNIIEEVSSSKWNYRHNILRHGICISRTCGKMENIRECLHIHYKEKFKYLGLVGHVVSKHCDTKNSEYIFTNLDLILISILGAYILFVLAVSISLEIAKLKPNNEDNPRKKNFTCIINYCSQNNHLCRYIILNKKFFSAFSISENLGYVFNTNSKPIQNYMLYIQGMRVVISVILIILHTGMMTVLPIKNPSLLEEESQKFLTIFLTRLATIVQGFFVISGWLLAIHFYEKLKKDEDLEFGFVVRTIIRRYIRLTPGRAVLIVLHTTYLIHLARGPFWPSIMDVDYQICRQRWWLHLSHFSNLFVDDIMCLNHTWSLTAEFQLTALGIVILWLTQKKPKLLLLLLGQVVSFQIIFMFFYLSGKQFEFGVLLTAEKVYSLKYLTTEEYQATWTTTYSNLSGLVSGLCFGYIYVNSNRNQFFRVEKYKILWLLMTFILTIGVMLFSSFYMTTEYYSNSRWFAASYGAISKPLFASGIGLFIFGVSQGLGGVVRRFLELPVMHTLGQLSFGAYLIHPTIIKIILGLNKELIQFSTSLVIFEGARLIMLAYLGSLVFTIFILLPMDRLSKRFLK